MIREDIENLNFHELTDLEKIEYQTILVLNLRKVCLQLMNSGNTQLAAILQISVNMAQMSPARLFELLQYAAKQYELVQVESELVRRTQVEADKQTPDDFPPLDTDKEQ
jgi:hypothetical protein